MANGMERNGASFGISTNRAQYPALNQQARSFGKMGPVTGTKPLPGGSQAAGLLRQPGPKMPRSGGMIGDSPIFKPRPPAGGVTGTLPGKPGGVGDLKPGGPNMQGPWPGLSGGKPGGGPGPRPLPPSGRPPLGSMPSKPGGFKPLPMPTVPSKPGGGGLTNPFIPRGGGTLGSGGPLRGGGVMNRGSRRGLRR